MAPGPSSESTGSAADAEFLAHSNEEQEHADALTDLLEGVPTQQVRVLACGGADTKADSDEVHQSALRVRG